MAPRGSSGSSVSPDIFALRLVSSQGRIGPGRGSTTGAEAAGGAEAGREREAGAERAAGGGREADARSVRPAAGGRPARREGGPREECAASGGREAGAEGGRPARGALGRLLAAGGQSAREPTACAASEKG